MAAIARDLRRGLGDHALESGTQLDAETFTTASLEAAREYSLAQDLLSSGDEEAAILRFASATRHDPQFGRAYSGWALAKDRLGRTAEARELFDKAFGLRDRMTRRERLRTEGLYMTRLRDHRAAVEIYRTLATEFPADSAALNNTAVAEFMLLDFNRALETGRRAVQLHPSVQHHQNLALYALYAGDTRTASEHAQKALDINPKSALAYLPLAVRAILDGNLDEAQRSYTRMSGVGIRGAALSAIGVADLEAFRGADQVARQHALAGLSSEATRTNTRVSGALHLLLAEIAMRTNDAREAQTRARLALQLDSSPATVFRSGEILALTGAHTEARTKLDALAKSPDPSAAWYRRILTARLAGTNGDPIALAALEKAFETEPVTWIARYAAGTMRLARGDPRGAIGHLDWCLQHYAQSTAAYFDDVPTVRYLAQARYWRGRALDEAGERVGATQAYEEFLRWRSPDDPLSRDARARLERLK